MSALRGLTVRDLTYHGKGEIGRLSVNFAKALPASTTGNLFTVTGSVAVTGLVGVVSTAIQASNVNPTIGVTGLPVAIAAAPAAPLNANVLGSVIILPPTLGGVLPTPLVASAAVTSAGLFVVSRTSITITTATTVTGAITWYLSYTPLYGKTPGSVAAV